MTWRGEVRFGLEAVGRLPWRVAWFVLRARRLANRERDVFSLDSALRPAKLAVLLEAARGRRTVVELGTGTAWTTVALAVDDPGRTVESWDPVVREQRERYVDLGGPDVRRRVAFVEGRGEDGPRPVTAGVELLFVDSSHERDPTLAEIAAWRPALAPGALVVFDDYGHPDYPGVAQAVADLGARGEQRGSLYIWRPDGPYEGRRPVTARAAAPGRRRPAAAARPRAPRRTRPRPPA